MLPVAAKSWVKSHGRLKAVISEGKRGKLFFKIEDIQALVDLKGQAVSSIEAATILKVNCSCIHKWTGNGKLKPISGPKVDGFGLNLYLRSDIENLHKEHEAFKVAQIQKGKTSRFGWLPSNYPRPVQENIAPRVEQLIREGKVSSPKRIVSPAQIYKHLIAEGYQVGIMTIYSYLAHRKYQTDVI
jgi:hypothetical protein